MAHEERLVFPTYSDFDVSNNAIDLIKKLICDKSIRLGQDGIDAFKYHAFFAGLDWDNIHTSK